MQSRVSHRGTIEFLELCQTVPIRRIWRYVASSRADIGILGPASERFSQPVEARRRNLFAPCSFYTVSHHRLHRPRSQQRPRDHHRDYSQRTFFSLHGPHAPLRRGAHLLLVGGAGELGSARVVAGAGASGVEDGMALALLPCTDCIELPNGSMDPAGRLLMYNIMLRTAMHGRLFRSEHCVVPSRSVTTRQPWSNSKSLERGRLPPVPRQARRSMLRRMPWCRSG